MLALCFIPKQIEEL